MAVRFAGIGAALRGWRGLNLGVRALPLALLALPALGWCR